MSTVDEQDCFAAFGPRHRRHTASISTTTSYLSDSGTRASPVSSRSSKRTSITDIVPTCDIGPSRTLAHVHRPTLTSYIHRDPPSGPSRHASHTPSSPRHMRNLSLPANPPRACRQEQPPPALPAPSPELHGLRDLLGRTKKLLGSCGLCDLRAPGCPLVVATDDGIARHLGPMDDDPRRSDAAASSSTWTLQSVTHADASQSLYLLLQRPVIRYGPPGQHGAPTFRLVARVDISGLVAPHGFRADVDDVWLDVAADAMRAMLGQKPHLRPFIPAAAHVLHAIPDLHPPIAHINRLYDAFVIMEPTLVGAAHEVTYLSAVQDERLRRVATGLQAGAFPLARHFALGYKFIFDARDRTDTPHEFVWCVPMEGRGVKCWVGFLMSSLA